MKPLCCFLSPALSLGGLRGLTTVGLQPLLFWVGARQSALVHRLLASVAQREMTGIFSARRWGTTLPKSFLPPRRGLAVSWSECGRNAAEQYASPCWAESLGIIILTVGLADFYFSPPAESREGRNVIELIRNDTQGPAPWEPFIPPPLFCRFSQPAQYRLDQALFSSSPASIPSHEASSVIPSARYPRLLSEAQGLHSSSGSQAVGPAHLDCTRAAGAGESTSFCETAHEKNESFHGVEIGGVQGSTEQKDDSVHTGEEEHLVEDRVKKAGEEFNAVARFSDARVPSQPPAAAFKACADDVLLNSLHQLLAEHAIWLRGSLDARLPEDFTAWRKKPAYAKTCFLFMDGPWRGCLCKIGYDPRQHPESRFSQTIDFRDPYFRNTSWRRISARQAGCSPLGGLTDSDPHSSAGSGLSSTFSSSAKAAQLEQQFLVPPSRPSVIYQFREIQDEAVQKLLRDAPMLPTPCKETGWFSAATMRTLRELLAMKSQRMRESRGEIPC
ncbi:rna polymerase iii transcription factor iiic [Cystoisospora suis]|uniref:Rna polymerase iii transcription factor iiic n=1 Tax=Cystoisospora suis TaxID=483139 RepID=A0A2C6KGT3_9APIC|nr:rna polymerase iii transcription factor iiic [Cystoisospora suis]